MELRCGKAKPSISDMADKVPDNEPAWFKKLLDRFEAVERSVQAIPKVEKSIDELHKRLDDIVSDRKSDIENTKKIQSNVVAIQEQNLALKNQLSQVTDKLANLESQSRRNNLVFTGIPETPNETWEIVEKKMYTFFENIMGIADAREISIERAHRLYTKQEKDNRPIIVKFLSFKDRQKVWQKRSTLAKQAVRIFEDYPIDVQAKRQKLWPIFKFAQGLKTEFKNVSLSGDKLYLNGKLYTTNNLDKLPASLQPEKRAQKCTDETLVFYSLQSQFSNFHPTPIKVAGDTYTCNEQYFQRAKALLFGDYETADKIMTETNPYKINSLGKRVKGYQKDVWERRAYDTLKHANTVKYNQNPQARQALLETGNLKLGEASPDTLYGTGVIISSPNASDESTWTGKNWMGQILTEIRTTLQDETSDDDS